MRRPALVLQRWAMCARRPDVRGEQIRDGVRAEAAAVDVGEQRRCSSAWRLLQPVLHRSADLACERRAPFLAALADTPDMRADAQRDGAATEPGDLPKTHAHLDRGEPHHQTATTERACSMRRGEERYDPHDP